MKNESSSPYGSGTQYMEKVEMPARMVRRLLERKQRKADKKKLKGQK